MEDKIAEHVQNLSNFENQGVLRNFHDLNVIVDSRTIDGERLVSLIPPDLLFRRLVLNNKEEIKVCTVLLKKLLGYVKPELVISEYEVAAVQGLNHPSEDVRELCLYQIERCVQTMSGLLAVIQTSDLLNFVIRSLSDISMSCAKIACNILVVVSRHEVGLAWLLDGTREAEFEELMRKSDTVRFRVYELFVKMVKCNHDVFTQIRPLFNKMVSEVNSSDVLIQMNGIELLTDVISTGKPGLLLTEESGVSKKLYEILRSPESNPLSLLLIPAVIKFFGFLAIQKPVLVYQSYPAVFGFVFNCIIDNDANLIGICLDTVGAVGLSNEGLRILFQIEQNRNILAKLGDYLQTSEEELRVRCLDCLASVFSSDDPSDKNVLDLIHSLYLKLAASPLELLFQVMKQPFNKIRISCFKTFHSLVSYQWMLEDLKNFPGFLEYLLDRRTESEKECQELKFEVVKKMSGSPYVGVVFDKPSVLKIKQFVRDGPFYVGSEVSVAMDGAQ